MSSAAAPSSRRRSQLRTSKMTATHGHNLKPTSEQRIILQASRTHSFQSREKKHTHRIQAEQKSHTQSRRVQDQKGRVIRARGLVHSQRQHSLRQNHKDYETDVSWNPPASASCWPWSLHSRPPLPHCCWRSSPLRSVDVERSSPRHAN